MVVDLPLTSSGVLVPHLGGSQVTMVHKLSAADDLLRCLVVEKVYVGLEVWVHTGYFG